MPWSFTNPDEPHPLMDWRAGLKRHGITKREAEVFDLVIRGNTLDQIAAALAITSSTVQDHISSLIRRTGAHNRSEMIAKILDDRP